MINHPLKCPLKFDVPSQIPDRERIVEIFDKEDGSSMVRWFYEDELYQEEYILHIRLDNGSVPKPDGSGVVSSGYPVTLNFYKRAQVQ